MPLRTQAVGVKAQLLTLSEVGVLVRKARTYELLSFVFAELVFLLLKKFVGDW